MSILLFFSFLSGLFTILAPCIWPLLPILLSSSTTGGKLKPLGITLGIVISFTFFTLSLSYIVKIIPFDPNILRLFAVVIIGFFGLTLIIPALNQRVEGVVSRLSGKFATQKTNKNGFGSGFITGLSLGIVWSPCAGPILATIATLAATRAVNFQIVLVTVVYSLGVGVPLFLFTLLGARIFNQSRSINRYTGRIQQIFGVIMILTAVAILTNFDKILQVKLLNVFPSYSSFIYRLEGNDAVQQELQSLRGKTKVNQQAVKFPMAEPGKLPDYGPAPEFTDITHWLNSSSLTMQSLKGKVVLVDFWTYTCINCIRTLPYVTHWYDTYKDKGFVVVGVHTPEFEFEKNSDNVANAIKQYKIHYPVAQDNNYGTWNAYQNQYWPAHYLIDSNGHIRQVHFGEGSYEETELAIQSLLKETGQQVQNQTFTVQGDTASGNISPETYLGEERMQYYYPDGSVSGGEQPFTLNEDIPVNTFSYGGKWNISGQYASSEDKAELVYHFQANKVFLVIHPPQNSSAKVNVFLDGKSISSSVAGDDVHNGVVTVDQPRLYNLVNFHGTVGNHTLKLDFSTQGTQVFAFTFG